MSNQTMDNVYLFAHRTGKRRTSLRRLVQPRHLVTIGSIRRQIVV